MEQPANSLSRDAKQEAPSTDRHTLDLLRSLLVGPEQVDIKALRERLNNPQLRASELSAVVAEAIRLRDVNGGKQALIEALTPTVEGALRRSARKDPQVLTEALFPVVGPTIRRSIVQYFHSMLESFNRTLDQSFSSQGVKWRIEAVRTGKTFGEVVILHSLIYRVEQVFLIHRKTSLILHHALAPGIESQDPALISGMLSAIQDFVRDSFRVSRDEVIDSMRVGELQVWMEEGPQAILAAVIRGAPPETLRVLLHDTLERVHQDLGPTLEQYAGDSSSFETVQDDLAHCLEWKFHEPVSKRPKPYFWIFVFILFSAAAAWIYVHFSREQQWNRFVDRLEAQPGIAVISLKRKGGQYHIHGFRDPLAVQPTSLLDGTGLNAKDVQFQWMPYQSLDDEIVLERVKLALRPPEMVVLSVKGGTLYAEGEASARWIDDLKARGLLISGVRYLDAAGLRDKERIDFERRRRAIESVLLLFETGHSELSHYQQVNFEKTAADIREILADAASVTSENLVIEITGHSDRTGAEAWNRLLSLRRAEGVARKLMQNKIGPTHLLIKACGYSQPVRIAGNGEDPRYDRSVTFRVSDPRPSEKGRNLH